MEIDKYSKISDFIQGDQITLGNQEYEFDPFHRAGDSL